MANAQQTTNKAILVGEKSETKLTFLHRMFEDEMKNGSSADCALIYEDEGVPKRQTKYMELNQNANQIANTILDLVKESAAEANQDGDWIIAICMKPSDNLVTTMLAIWKSGAAYLPIDVDFPQNRIDYILKNAKPVLVIYDDSYPNSSYFTTAKSTNFGDLKRESTRMDSENISDEQTLTKGDANAKAVTIYTSGSTGMPKGVRLKHINFVHRIMWTLKNYPFSKSEAHCVFKTPLTFVDHVPELMCPLFNGLTVIVIPKEVLKNPELFVPILDDYKVERILGVPTLLQGILLHLNMMENNKTKFMLSNLRMWASSGEALTVQLVKDFFAYFSNGKHFLINFYGCTELTCDVSFYELRSKEEVVQLDRVPLGTPLTNTILYILNNENLKPVDEEEVGEIYCAGVMVSDGYINEKEPGSFIKNPMEPEPPFCNMYRTGDFGMIKDGLLYFEGRRDSQIKVRGHRVDVTEVEKNINELNYVDKSAVLVYQNMQLDQALVAFVSAKSNIEKALLKSPADIEKDLKNRLADYMIPQVQIIAEFPYLPNGKVDRHGLLKFYEETAVKNKPDVKLVMGFKNVPKEKLTMAKQVFEIVGNSIGKELRSKVSAKANFFDLGGNSMNSIYTVTQLRSQGFFISITDFLKAENLGDALKKISLTNALQKADDLRIMNDMKLILEPFDEIEQEECMRVLAMSFFNKADLDKFLPNLKLEHYLEIFGSMWDAAIKKGLSFMVKNNRGDLVGVSLNFDASDAPEIESTNNPLGATFDFLNSIEKPVIENQLKASMGQLFHALMMGTSDKLNTRQNIAVMTFMENEVIKLATTKGFKGIVTVNTNPLAQQFGETVFGYQTVSDIRVNKYVDRSGHRPFGMAPDTQKVLVMYKDLKK